MVTFHRSFRWTAPLNYCGNRSGPWPTHTKGPFIATRPPGFTSPRVKWPLNKLLLALWTWHKSFSSRSRSDTLTSVCPFDFRSGPRYDCARLYLRSAPVWLAGSRCGKVKVCCGKGSTLTLINGPLCTPEWAIIRGLAHSFITVTEQRHGPCHGTVPDPQRCLPVHLLRPEEERRPAKEEEGNLVEWKAE